jgi:hypothetical protein
MLADGPTPASTGRSAWATNGMPPNDERLLTAALNKANVERHHHGRPGTPQRWWWKLPGDHSSLVGVDTTAQQCNVCHQTLDLPAIPRPCISTPRCPGSYRPTTRQATPIPQCRT